MVLGSLEDALRCGIAAMKASLLTPGVVILRQGNPCRVESVTIVPSPLPAYKGNVVRVEHSDAKGLSKTRMTVHFTLNHVVPCES